VSVGTSNYDLKELNSSNWVPMETSPWRNYIPHFTDVTCSREAAWSKTSAKQIFLFPFDFLISERFLPTIKYSKITFKKVINLQKCFYIHITVLYLCLCVCVCTYAYICSLSLKVIKK
jgi:hypothetical protein